MKQVILIRHGQADNNLHNLVGGWSELNLTELGIKQAQAVAQRLDEELKGTYKIYSSELNRAKQTAEIICKQLEVTPTYAFELREHNSGIASGMTREWADKHWNQVSTYTLDHRPFTGSESWGEFYDRVSSFMNKLVETEDHVLLVSHGGTIQNIIKWWIGTPVSDLLKVRFGVSNASITILDSVFNQRRIERLNDTTHYAQINTSNPINYPS